MASTILSRTPSGNGNNKTWTYSAWVKRSGVGSWGGILDAGDGSSWTDIYFYSDDKLVIRHYTSGSTPLYIETDRKFRDPNAWYHIVCACDTTQSTASDRFKIYVNGVQETSLGSPTYPSQNYDTYINSANAHRIGISKATGGSSNYFNGVLSHVHLVDGSALAPTVFGETDSTTGEWKIKTSPSYTVGTNGFFILKDGNSVTDQSGNSNNFTVSGGTLTSTHDNPSNVFATINPLVPYSSNYDFYNGNTTVENDGSSAAWTTRWGVSTLGMSSGKFYAEAKIANIGTNQMYALGLIKDVGTFAPSSSVGANGLGYYSTGNIYNGISGQDQTGLASYTTNDIIGLAIDATNGSAQWYKNGSAIGNAETIATDGTWFFVTNFYTNGKVDMNYGNGYFGTTAVSSAGTNASGIGIFEYNVPTGYTALSTKGLNL